MTDKSDCLISEGIGLPYLFFVFLVNLLNVKHVRMVLQMIVGALSDYFALVHYYDFVCKMHEFDSVGDKNSRLLRKYTLENIAKDSFSCMTV